MNIPEKEEIKTENKEERMQSMRDEKPDTTLSAKKRQVGCLGICTLKKSKDEGS